MDGVKILDLTGLNTDSYGDVKQIRFGINYGKNIQNSVDVYGDCAVVSNAYIGTELVTPNRYSRQSNLRLATHRMIGMRLSTWLWFTPEHKWWNMKSAMAARAHERAICTNVL